ncbi:MULTISPECIES: hypothetical protein [Bacteria]|uniref:hypothetical protein n=1 Tax=Bacteria TaxID=2 RepID=UPI003C7D9173
MRTLVIVPADSCREDARSLREEIGIWLPDAEVILTATEREGVVWALGHGHDAVIRWDAGAACAHLLPDLLDALEDADLVVGDRGAARSGRCRRGWGPTRLANALLRRLIGTDVRDVLSGVRASRTDALRRVHAIPLASDESAVVELLHGAERAGLRVAEVPLVRAGGVPSVGAGSPAPAILRALLAASRVRRSSEPIPATPVGARATIDTRTGTVPIPIPA